MIDETKLIHMIKERQEIHAKDIEDFRSNEPALDDDFDYMIAARIDELEVILKMIEEISKIEKCGDCSRRKWYQTGYKDGANQK